ncbi:sir2 family histone deacetylase, partial [Moniliophthora roreri]
GSSWAWTYLPQQARLSFTGTGLYLNTSRYAHPLFLSKPAFQERSCFILYPFVHLPPSYTQPRPILILNACHDAGLVLQKRRPSKHVIHSLHGTAM